MQCIESRLEPRPTRLQDDAVQVIRRLGGADRPAVLGHLCALGSDDRELRFGCAMSLSAIARYVDGLDFERDVALGVMDVEGKVVAMAQILPLGPELADAEIAFSVLAAARCRGLGHGLMKAVCGHASECGLRKLVAQVHCRNRPMLAVFRRAGMRLDRDREEITGVLEVAAEAPSSAG